MIWDVINSIGTLLFAGIALFAIFYPEIKRYYRRAKFSYKVTQYGPDSNKSVFIQVENTGKSPSYGLRCLLQVEYDGKIILNGKQAPSRRINKDNLPGETYDGVDLYPAEEIGFQLIHFGARYTGQPKNLLEITSYPWIWRSSNYAELNSMDRDELKTSSERVYNIVITLVDKDRIYPKYKLNFSYDELKLKIL